MRIGIDARFGLSGGIDRYIVELIDHLARVDRRNSYYIYVSPGEYKERLKTTGVNFNIIPVEGRKYHYRAPLVLSQRIRKDRIDVFHSPSYWLTPFFPRCPLVVTVHDTFALNGTTHSLRGRLYGRISNVLAIRKAAKIILISRYTKDQLAAYFPGYEKKMRVIHHGVGEEFRRRESEEVDGILEGYGLKRGFLLYAGNLKSNKNIGNLIRAYSQLPPGLRSEHPLVMVGGRMDADICDAVRMSGLNTGEEVFIIDHTENTDELAALYNGARALVMPSVTEFFGLPVIEAMSCGIPVVSSNTSSLPEVAGDAALYFNPRSINDIKMALEMISMDDNLCRDLVSRGRENIKRFSWHRTALEVLKVYEESSGAHED